MNLNLPTVPDDVQRDALAFVKRVIGPVAELSDLLSDEIRYFRWKNSVRTIARAKVMAESAGITPKEIPVKFLFPMLGHASLETEADMAERWAALLANAAGGFSSRHFSVMEALQRLSSREARSIQRMYDRASAAGVLGYYRDGSESAEKVPSFNLSAIGERALASIAEAHPLKDLDDMRVDKFGRMFVRDLVAAKEKSTSARRGLLLPDADFDLVSEVDSLDRLGLVSHYGLGHAFSANSTYFVWWAELKRFGLEFVDSVNAPSIESRIQ